MSDRLSIREQLFRTCRLVDEGRDKEVRFFYAMVMGKNTRMLELLRHLASRFLRKVLNHTLAVCFCRQARLLPLRFCDLLTE
jgi:hypothetical protein